ncbi:HIV Tat-specific factor 1 -like protein [Caligus rogercresseyi]|uniref:HIV Tat-specific factor 1 -like protein n=1 Tax=Caligus rogercresseyi TaxID=217165 RepID=A0A7T8H131_CALRO|nr:HIV Tat-specific factor 1 -like protein [Caligus rogercresseyi]
MPGWNPSANISKDSESGTQTYTDPSDGTLYEWDASKKAWFPKIDTDFMAVYQLNYGFTSDGKAQTSVPTPSPALTVVNNPEPGANNKTKAKQQQQIHKAKSPNGFRLKPPRTRSISEEKFISMMSRFGVIETDVRNENKPKIKLYRDSNGIPKGDALCSFVMVESVDLAIQILDDSLYEDGRSRISVERARFQMKGEAYKPELKPKKLRKKELDKLRKTKDKKLAWDFDCHKVLVISNLFTPLDFNEEPEKIFEVKGNIRKVEIFDQHPEGVGLVFFRDFEETDVAIDMLNGRLLNGRAIKTVHWDGKTKYENKETQEEEMKRLHVWNKFLEEEENNKEDSID